MEHTLAAGSHRKRLGAGLSVLRDTNIVHRACMTHVVGRIQDSLHCASVLHIVGDLRQNQARYITSMICIQIPNDPRLTALEVLFLLEELGETDDSAVYQQPAND